MLGHFGKALASVALSLLLAGGVQAATFTGTASSGPEGASFGDLGFQYVYIPGYYRVMIDTTPFSGEVLGLGTLINHYDFAVVATGEPRGGNEGEVALPLDNGGDFILPSRDISYADDPDDGLVSRTEYFFAFASFNLYLDPDQTVDWRFSVTRAPEPNSWALMALGLAALGAQLRRRRIVGSDARALPTK